MRVDLEDRFRAANVKKWTLWKSVIEGTHELTMDITTDCHRTPHWLHVGLFHQDFARLAEAQALALYKDSMKPRRDEQCIKQRRGGPECCYPEQYTHLVAKSFDIGLRQLFALAKLLNPGIDFVLHGLVFLGL